MISDFVKGKKKFDYPPAILAGINLHRAIDQFTDNHEATRRAKEVFRPDYRLYSGAFVDVVYDHFLASDPAEFPNKDLFNFSQQVYSILERHTDWLPAPFAAMFPYMRTHNWLYHYQTIEGAGKSMGGVVRRSAYLHDSDTARRLFEQHYQLLQECYQHFWATMKPFAKSQYELLQGISGGTT